MHPLIDITKPQMKKQKTSILRRPLATLTKILLFLSCCISCNKDGMLSTEDDSNFMQTDQEGKLAPLNGAGVAIAVATAGNGRFRVSSYASESQSTPYADVWLDGNSRMLKFDVADQAVAARFPLRGNVEKVNPLVQENMVTPPEVYKGGIRSSLSVGWGRWEGDYFFKGLPNNDNEQEYDGPPTLPLTYAFSNNATSTLVLNDLEQRGVTYIYRLFHGDAIYFYRDIDTGEFVMTNGFGQGTNNQTVVEAIMEVQFGTDANAGVKNFTLTTNFGGTTDTLTSNEFESTGVNYAINQDLVVIEPVEDCNICHYDLATDLGTGQMRYRFIGANAEHVIGSFRTSSNTHQSIYGTFILTRIESVTGK